MLHGLQLWIALPEQDRFTEPAFAHHPALPVVRHPGATVTVVIGSYEGSQSPGAYLQPAERLGGGGRRGIGVHPPGPARL